MLTININGKEVRLRDVLNTINDIYKIVNNSCPKCQDLTDKEKLEKIRKIIENRLYYGKKNNG